MQMLMIPASQIPFRILIQFARHYCETATVVVRDEAQLARRACDLLQELSPYIFEYKQIDGRVMKLRFSLNDFTTRTLLDSATRLNEWYFPSLPENFSLYRFDGTVLLTSCATENFYQLRLFENEYKFLRTEFPRAFDS